MICEFKTVETINQFLLGWAKAGYEWPLKKRSLKDASCIKQFTVMLNFYIPDDQLNADTVRAMFQNDFFQSIVLREWMHQRPAYPLVILQYLKRASDGFIYATKGKTIKPVIARSDFKDPIKKTIEEVKAMKMKDLEEKMKQITI